MGAARGGGREGGAPGGGGEALESGGKVGGGGGRGGRECPGVWRGRREGGAGPELPSPRVRAALHVGSGWGGGEGRLCAPGGAAGTALPPGSG